MSTLYIITNTFGDDIFSIKPGGLNGPGGTQADTDLRLYGQGATEYGEGVNENLFRLTESFACPEKSTPDEGTPQDDSDLGPGNGINNPVNGQPWYNTTTKKLMVYDGDGSTFASVSSPISSATAPASPVEGDLWYDTTVPQLKVYNGAAWLSSANWYLLLDGTSAMTGSLNLGTHTITDVVDPVNPQDAATKFYVDELRTDIDDGTLVDDRYLRKETDDTMAGNLTMSGNISMGNTFKIIVDTGTALAPSLSFDSDPDTGMYSLGANVIGFATNGVLRLSIQSNGILNVGTANYETFLSDVNDIPNKKYVDDASAASGLGETPINGIIMYSGALIALPANWVVCDGTGGTPNLIDKFVLGTVTEGEIGDTGGSADAVAVSHSHTFSGNALPTHDHSLQFLAVAHGTGEDSPNAVGTEASTSGTVRTMNYPNNKAISKSAGTPTGSISTAGVSGTNANLPPYVKLIYIMRQS